ncbi:MAG TPA: ABC transporter substrate-binding protein [Acidimicrobiales bacterium]
MIGNFTHGPGLDPAKASGGSNNGAFELAAMYDLLIHYNPETAEFEPGTAESLEPNDDYSEWTLRLRPGIRFTDGTPYDANAVKFSIERLINEGASTPRVIVNTFIGEVRVVDDLTVVFRSKIPWNGFPSILSGIAGLVYSPTAFAKAGADFNVNPGDAGAGPFKLAAYRPGESVELERNPEYWGGEVHLDRLKFISLPGADLNLEAILADTLHVAIARDPEVVARARDEGLTMIDLSGPASNIILMNAGVDVTCNQGQPANLCAGRADGERVPTQTATRDVRVRQAVAHAVDPEVVNERVWGGQALAGSAPFANFRWDPGVPGPNHDPDEARRLVEAAKADGWDGTIRLIAGNDPQGSAWMQAIEPQLRGVGMNVQVDTTLTTQQVIAQVLVNRDYDLALWSHGIPDDPYGAYTQLIGAFDSRQKRYGYGTPEMDAAIDSLRVAETDIERVEAFRRIGELWVRDMPAAVIGVVPTAYMLNPDVHGVRRTGSAILVFDKAWIG